MTRLSPHPGTWFERLLLIMNTIRCLIGAAVAAFAALAQPPPPAVYNTIENASNLPMQKIGADDLIGITVYDAPELSRAVRVAADGTIRLPMLKQRIRAAGFLPADIETAISAALSKEEIMVEPVVSVSIVEYRSRPISVVGAVRRPLTFQAMGSLTLLDALSRAEGLTDGAGPEILVSRVQPGPDGRPATLVQRISILRLITAADPELNLRLEGGEEVRVPDAGRIFVVGNIKKPGTFPIKDSSESSVLKALAFSEGLLPYAADSAYIYRQEGALGRKNEIQIELKKIMERKSPDVVLLANDILYIPDNKTRRSTMNVLEKALGIGGGLGGALIYTMGR